MKKSPKFSSVLFLSMLLLPSYNLLAQNSSFRIKVKSGLQNTPPYLVKYYNSNNWEKFYVDILKFDYDPKYEYDIKVAKHKEGPNSIYTLTKTFAKSLSEKTDVATWEISDSYVNAQRLGKLKCLQIKTDKKNKWEYLNTPIRGFDFQEGYRYRIRVKQTKQKDIDTIDYSLVEIISKERTNELPSIGGKTK